MQAITVAAGQVRYRNDYPQPVPQVGEALLRVSLAGICATDLEIVKGYAGFQGVLGHEFVGVVDQVADAADAAWVGRCVVGTINIGCGGCPTCLSVGPEHCPQRRALGIHAKDGAFADYVTLPVANLLATPEGVTDEAAVFTEPLAAALRVREQVHLRPAQQTAVVGPGRLGLLIGQVLALDGADVVMLGRRAAALALPARLGLAAALVDDCPDSSFDCVVEATGNAAGLAHALRLVRPRGVLVLKSTFAGQVSLDLTRLVVSEITVVGSRCGPFAPALRLLAHQAVNVQALIAAAYPLRDALAAFDHAARPGVRKVLLRP